MRREGAEGVASIGLRPCRPANLSWTGAGYPHSQCQQQFEPCCETSLHTVQMRFIPFFCVHVPASRVLFLYLKSICNWYPICHVRAGLVRPVAADWVSLIQRNLVSIYIVVFNQISSLRLNVCNPSCTKMDKVGQTWTKVGQNAKLSKRKTVLFGAWGTSWTWYVLRSCSCWWFGPGGDPVKGQD